MALVTLSARTLLAAGLFVVRLGMVQIVHVILVHLAMQVLTRALDGVPRVNKATSNMLRMILAVSSQARSRVSLFGEIEWSSVQNHAS